MKFSDIPRVRFKNTDYEHSAVIFTPRGKIYLKINDLPPNTWQDIQTVQAVRSLTICLDLAKQTNMYYMFQHNFDKHYLLSLIRSQRRYWVLSRKCVLNLFYFDEMSVKEIHKWEKSRYPGLHSIIMLINTNSDLWATQSATREWSL
jgi:hypothetical protein